MLPWWSYVAPRPAATDRSHAGAPSRSPARCWRPRPVNDTWIAACCLVDGLPLATLSVIHTIGEVLRNNRD